MKKLCGLATFLVALVLVVSMGSRNSGPAFATVLDGFAINTEDKAVTVTLYTDERAQYTTDSQGKQFTILLPETQLSKEQLENGLPVVIDNKNKIIGRAVPTDDGHVKIVLPNLPASEYSVSVQQKRPGQPPATAMKATSSKPVAKAPVIQPRAPMLAESQFEQVASKVIQQGEASHPAAPVSTSTVAPIHLGPTPTTSAYGGSKAIWNPYVVKPTPAPRVAARPKPAAPQWTPPPVQEAPINTVSVAEPPRSTPVNDPLWYLHSLPPANTSLIPQDNLKGLAMDPSGLLQPAQPAEAAATAQAAVAGQPSLKTVFADLKEVVKSLPKWLLVLGLVFIGGISLFTLVGSIVLMKILFGQMRAGSAPAMPQPYMAYGPGYMPMGFDPAQVYGAPGVKSPYATAPTEKPQVSFKDTASVNAMDYLKESPDNVSEAVHNAVLLKFPTHQKRKMGARKRVNSRRTPSFH